MAVVLIRTVIFYILTICAIRFMGKRQIGELEPSELVITIIISELATIPMQDAEYPIINIALSIFALTALEILSAAFSLKSKAFGTMIAGTYNVVVENGVINQEEMKKAQLSVSELYEEIRLKGALDVSDVKFCILETSGKMSVLLKSDTTQNSVPYPLIVDGKVIKENLPRSQKTEAQLLSEAKKQKAKELSDVFLCIDNDGTLEWTIRQKDGKKNKKSAVHREKDNKKEKKK